MRRFSVGFLVFALTTGIGAVERGDYGLGFFGSAQIPVLKFSDWYSASPKVGLSFNYVATPRILAEVEYHYATMRGGDLHQREFTWIVDQNPYRSQNVSQSMWFHSFLGSGLFHLKSLDQGGISPYVAVGMGFFGFSNKVSGLIFPGQAGQTLDQNLKLEPYDDRWAALTFSIGGGVSIPRSERFMIDLRTRYNITLGELRPLEDWGLSKAFPIQALDVMIGFRYFW